MALVQLDFFESDATSELKARMEAVELSASKVRKKLFAENGALKKQVCDLSERLAIMERNICKS
jgi:hypothetical protein